MTSRTFKMSDFPPQYFGFELGVTDLPDFKSANFRKALTVQMNLHLVLRGAMDTGQLFGTGRHETSFNLHVRIYSLCCLRLRSLG